MACRSKLYPFAYIIKKIYSICRNLRKNGLNKISISGRKSYFLSRKSNSALSGYILWEFLKKYEFNSRQNGGKKERKKEICEEKLKQT
jgi:hypothetical protein